MLTVFVVGSVLLIGRATGGLWHEMFYFNVPWRWASAGDLRARVPLALAWNAVQVVVWILWAVFVAVLLDAFL